MGHLIFYCLHRHQAVRWLNTKEEHAGREKRLLAPCRITCLPEPQPSMNRIDCSPAGIIENMSEYMLAQRIKPPAEPTGPKQEQYVALLQVVADFLDRNEMRALLSVLMCMWSSGGRLCTRSCGWLSSASRTRSPCMPPTCMR